jgi:hypothetical protein
MNPMRSVLGVFALSAAASLSSCGGDVIAVAFVGAVGGDFVRDEDDAQPGAQATGCGGGGCVVTINPTAFPQDPFAASFDVTYQNATSVPGCAASGSGRIDGRSVRLTGCFDGEFETINRVRASDGRRWFRNAGVDLIPGIWQEVETGQRRFKFETDDGGDPDQAFVGCELTTPTRRTDAVVTKSDVRNPAGPFDTTVTSFIVTGAGGAWTGTFNGISNLTLRRGTETMQLERRQGSASC